MPDSLPNRRGKFAAELGRFAPYCLTCLRRMGRPHKLCEGLLHFLLCLEECPNGFRDGFHRTLNGFMISFARDRLDIVLRGLSQNRGDFG